MTTSEILRPIAPHFNLWVLTVSNRLQKFTEAIQGTIQEQPTHLAGTKVSHFQPLNRKHTVAAECSSLLLSSSVLESASCPSTANCSNSSCILFILLYNPLFLMLGFIQHSFQMNSTSLYLLSTFIPSTSQILWRQVSHMGFLPPASSLSVYFPVPVELNQSQNYAAFS